MKFLTLAFVINFIIACWPTVNIIVKEKFSFTVTLLKSQNQVSVFQMLLSTVISNK